jgi:hypothetical protein
VLKQKQQQKAKASTGQRPRAFEIRDLEPFA